MNVVALGLSITSSWGNGHASTWRALVRELARRGHRVLSLEPDVPWYAAERDLPGPPWGTTRLYRDLDELRAAWTGAVRAADLVVVGSYVPEGVAVGRWVLESARGVRAFYDIDTPVTLAKLARSDHDHLDPELVRAFDLYLSFSGGRALEVLERQHGAALARPLYCSVDPAVHRPVPGRERWLLGHLGTWSPDRQPALERLLLEPARRRPERGFAVAGPQYPPGTAWPANVERIEHVAPGDHAAFFAAQRFTLNVTRAAMVALGTSPSVRLFEAAACGVPVISDRWEGFEAFFTPGEEGFVADGPEDVLRILDAHGPEAARRVGEAARRRILAAHTAEHRVNELLRWYAEAREAGVARR